MLRLVNDSELEDATGSIGGCVLGQAGQEMQIRGRGGEKRSVGEGVKRAAEREKYLLEKRGEVLRRAKASKTYLKPLNRGAKGR